MCVIRGKVGWTTEFNRAVEHKMFSKELQLLLALMSMQTSSATSHVCFQKFIKPENYSATEAAARPARAHVHFFVLGVGNVNQQDKTFIVQMWIEVRWVDQRLSGYNIPGDGCSDMLLTIRNGHIPDLWLPDFEFNWSNTGG